MHKLVVCLGLVGCLGLQNAAFATADALAASLIAAPEPSRTIENVYYYHHHYYPYRYHGKYYHHRTYRNGHWHYY
jgi:hypothetical protein